MWLLGRARNDCIFGYRRFAADGTYVTQNGKGAIIDRQLLQIASRRLTTCLDRGENLSRDQKTRQQRLATLDNHLLEVGRFRRISLLHRYILLEVQLRMVIKVLNTEMFR